MGNPNLLFITSLWSKPCTIHPKKYYFHKKDLKHVLKGHYSWARDHKDMVSYNTGAWCVEPSLHSLSICHPLKPCYPPTIASKLHQLPSAFAIPRSKMYSTLIISICASYCLKLRNAIMSIELLLMSWIFPNKKSIAFSYIIVHKWFCLVECYILIIGKCSHRPLQLLTTGHF